MIAVIFTSTRSSADEDGYRAMSERMDVLAREQDGFVSIVSVRDPATREGISVSYWRDEASALAWKQVAEHLQAQELGRDRWYVEYATTVAEVTRSYRHPRVP